MPPVQNVVAPDADIDGVGSALTVTVVGAEVPVPAADVTVTAYDPVVLTVMDCVVAPVLHV
jgi:hypothetical protein